MSSRSINIKFSKVLFLFGISIFLILIVYTINLGLFGNIILNYKPIVLSDKVVRGSIYSSDNISYAIEVSKYKMEFISGISDENKDKVLALTNGLKDNINEELKNKILSIDPKYIKFEKYYIRKNPQSPILKNVLGETNNLLYGKTGLEFEYDEILKSEPILGNKEIIYGNDIYLSINSYLQFNTNKIIEKIAANNKNIDSILTLVVNNSSGSVKTFASYNFDSLDDILNKQYSYGDFYYIFDKKLENNHFDKFKTKNILHRLNTREDKINIFNLAKELTSLCVYDRSYKDLSLIEYIKDYKNNKIYREKSKNKVINENSNNIISRIANNDTTIKMKNPSALILPIRDINLDACFAIGPETNNNYSVITFVELTDQNSQNTAVEITKEIVRNIIYNLDYY